MVEKITIFEPHFDGAQFGPASIDGDALPGAGADEAESTEVPAIEADVEAEDLDAELDAAESGGRRLGIGPLAVLAVVLAGGVLLARRRLGRRAGAVDQVE